MHDSTRGRNGEGIYRQLAADQHTGVRRPFPGGSKERKKENDATWRYLSN